MAQTDFTAQETSWMRLALSLAAQATGFTSPNPMVGAVLVKDGEIVGSGYHHQAGLAHAEVEAIRNAQEKANGASLYVTLEPCNHHGRTPPCTEAIIAAGIRKVVYAMRDPNPRVNGSGAARLRSAGIEVLSGLLEEDALQLNRAFSKYIQSGLPYVIGKWAMSLDGKIATHSGDARWISSPASRQQGHALRASVDAILVGRGTVLADDPQLTTRLAGYPKAHHPLRIVLDSHASLPPTRQIFSPALPGKTLLVSTDQADQKKLALLQQQGVETLCLPATTNGRIDLAGLLATLGQRKILSLMVEGGGQVLGAFADAQLFDEIWVFLAPLLIGGSHAPSPVAGAGAEKLADSLKFSQVHWQTLDQDLWLTAKRSL